MKILFVLLVVAGCTPGPPPLSQTPKDAAVWDLNPNRSPASNLSPPETNDLIRVQR